MEIGTVRCCLDNQVLWLSRESSRKLDWRNIHPLPHIVTTWKLKVGYQRLISTGKHSLNHVFWRRHSIHTSLEESSSVQGETYSGNDEYAQKDSQENHLSQPLRSNELKSLLADSERTKLVKKLSEANQQNRFLKRQLHIKEDALVNFKSELAVLELEIQALVKLAEENTKSVISQGSRKINGKYIQSHLLSRLEAVHEKLKEQIKDVDAVQSKEVPLFWYGMAEAVMNLVNADKEGQGGVGLKCASYGHFRWLESRRTFIIGVYRFFHHVLDNINAQTWKVLSCASDVQKNLEFELPGQKGKGDPSIFVSLSDYRMRMPCWPL
ncbi:hypothetical protein GBA52_024304 [Prunus armeniaca]|nr:hypothetical protein GBA52_024304 [Prunus armeniaca]